MDQASTVSRAATRSNTTPSLSSPGVLAEAFSTSGSEAEPSGEPDSPEPRPTSPHRSSPRAGAANASSAVLIFDQPLGIVGGFLLGLLTLVVPIAGVVMDRHLLPSRTEAGATPDSLSAQPDTTGFGSVAERPSVRRVVAAESPGSQGPERTVPGR
jgi:hypothetical protein